MDLQLLVHVMGYIGGLYIYMSEAPCLFVHVGMWPSARSYTTNKFGDAYTYANGFSGFMVPRSFDCSGRPACIAIYGKALARLYM